MTRLIPGPRTSPTSLPVGDTRNQEMSLLNQLTKHDTIHTGTNEVEEKVNSVNIYMNVYSGLQTEVMTLRRDCPINGNDGVGTQSLGR
jgi:hypothetical protein